MLDTVGKNDPFGNVVPELMDANLDHETGGSQIC